MYKNRRKKTTALSTCAFCIALAGCNGLTEEDTSSAATNPPIYMAPSVAPAYSTGAQNSATYSIATYLLDDGAGTFSQSTTQFSGAQQGTQIKNSGTAKTLARGLVALSTTFEYPYFPTSTTPGTTFSPPLAGGFAVELPAQAGGVVQLLSTAATPVASTQSCPDLATAQTFQFITLPAAVTSANPGTNPLSWNPAKETAFGSVKISSNGTAFSLSNIQEFTLPVSGGAPGSPTTSYASSASGTCAPTPYGNILSVPNVVTITNPGGGQTVVPPAAIGIGPSGFLVENNGGIADNLLGAGTGAVGVPQPPSELDTTAVAAAQYQGFIYATGIYAGSTGSGATSTTASFGFPTLPSTCASVATQTPTMLYGGDFPLYSVTGLHDPSNPAVQSNGGFGNCNFAIDFGQQSTSSYGLYPSATVYLASGFSGNTANTPHSFSAVAIVSQLQGKYVVLFIGKDTTQGWSGYLIQSN